jgi:DNA adenine methylase
MFDIKMNSPVPWYGGKGMLKRKILPVLERIPHRVYVEPFGGGASVLLAKQPKPIEIYNDIYSQLVNFFEVVANKDSFEKFRRTVSLLPVSRQLFMKYVNEIKTETDSIKRAVMFFYLGRNSFNGIHGKSFKFFVGTTEKVNKSNFAYLNTVKRLPLIHQRLQRVVLENYPALKIIDLYDRADTLFYCDPPYVLQTRTKGNVYKYEMNDTDHKQFIERILTIQGQAVISGYNNELYQPLCDNGWEQIEFESPIYASNIKTIGARKYKTEVLWISPLKDKTNLLF